MVTKEFKTILADRFDTAELAEFLQIDVKDFIEMFEEDIEVNYDELAEFVGLRRDYVTGKGDNEFDEDGTTD